MGRVFRPQAIFTAFKYSVYALLTLNIFLFFQEESLATDQIFSGGVNLVDIIQGFAATIDTAAWLVLLLLFELQTSVLDEAILRKPNVKAWFFAARTFSYGFILYAFYGYLTKMLLIYNISPLPIQDVCNLVGQGFSSIVTLDEYSLLNAQSCLALMDTELSRLDGEQVLGSAADWEAIQWLAWVDVINSLTWIAVVVILEIDLWLQRRGRLAGNFVDISKLLKMLFYSILFAAAAYWGLLGDFLDFWDAFLWLVAFFFIERKLIEWQAHTSADSSG